MYFFLTMFEQKIKKPLSYLSLLGQTKILFFEQYTFVFFPDKGSGKRHFIKRDIKPTNAAVSTTNQFCSLFAMFNKNNTMWSQLFKLSEMKWRSYSD